MKVSVDAGGEMEFKPFSLSFAPINYTQDIVSPMANNGTLKLPNGIELTGESIGGNCTFSLRQYDGDLELGGNIADRSETDHLDFNLTGGVVRVTNDAKFIGCRNVVMTNDAAAEISVAAGARLAVTGGDAITLRDGIKLTVDGSAGAGTFANMVFPENGTLELVNVPEFSGSLEMSITGENATGLDNISNWGLSVNGIVQNGTKYRCRYSNGKIVMYRPGTVVVFR
jgi:hypothetical protein